MSRIQTCFVNTLSRALSDKEQEAVLGDLFECRTKGWQAAHELLLLLLHRQVSHWREWKPWLAICCIVPTAIVLSQISRNITGFVVMELWTRTHSGTWFQTALSGTRTVVVVACISSAVVPNGWCSGLLAVVLSRATIFVTASAFYAVWLFCGAALPLTTSAGWYNFAATFCLFAIPSALGMVYGFHSNTLKQRPALWFLIFVTVGTIASIWTYGWFGRALEVWSSGKLTHTPVETRAWPFVISALPAFYLYVHGRLIGKRPMSQVQG